MQHRIHKDSCQPGGTEPQPEVSYLQPSKDAGGTSARKIGRFKVRTKTRSLQRVKLGKFHKKKCLLNLVFNLKNLNLLLQSANHTIATEGHKEPWACNPSGASPNRNLENFSSFTSRSESSGKRTSRAFKSARG